MFKKINGFFEKVSVELDRFSEKMDSSSKDMLEKSQISLQKTQKEYDEKIPELMKSFEVETKEELFEAVQDLLDSIKKRPK